MKAVVIEEPNKMTVSRIEDPTPGAGEAVVKVEACGICGTDIHVLRGEFAPTRYPIVPGHEFCGEVVAVASDVRNVKTGDFVAVDPSLFCGKCRQCPATGEPWSSRSPARFTASTRSICRSRRIT